MPADRDEPPQYTRYRARRRLLGDRDEELGGPRTGRGSGAPGGAPDAGTADELAP